MKRKEGEEGAKSEKGKKEKVDSERKKKRLLRKDVAEE